MKTSSVSFTKYLSNSSLLDTMLRNVSIASSPSCSVPVLAKIWRMNKAITHLYPAYIVSSDSSVEYSMTFNLFYKVLKQTIWSSPPEPLLSILIISIKCADDFWMRVYRHRRMACWTILYYEISSEEDDIFSIWVVCIL